MSDVNVRERLKAMLAQANRATPGPWATRKPGTDAEGWPNGVAVAFVARGQGVYANPPGGSFPAADQDFIAAARTNMPLVIRALLAAIEQRNSALDDIGGVRASRQPVEDARLIAILEGREG